MRDPARLDALLRALRAEGIAIGVAEIHRLHSLAERWPTAQSAERLRSVMAAVLAKSRRQREVFDRVFDAWSEEAAAHLAMATAQGLPVDLAAAPRRDRPASRPRRRPRAASGLGVFCAAAAVFALAVGIEIVRAPPRGLESWTPPVLPQTRRAPEDDWLEVPIRERRFVSWVPYLEVIGEAPERVGPNPWALPLAALAALSTLGVGWWRWRRLSLPEEEPPARLDGPSRVYVSAPAGASTSLLDGRQREILVWGLERSESEAPSRRLDLRRTVRATARRGGVPELHFEPEKPPREVWLWVDASAEDPTVAALAQEVATTLRRHGLRVERASFWGVPDELERADGGLFRPREVDEHRGRAVVAVLTDGRLWLRRRESAIARPRVESGLRDLSHWPRLALVDFSPGDALAAMAEAHGLRVVAPSELADFLGGVVTRRDGRWTADDRLWAAACAMCPSPIDQATALALRPALGLDASPWALRALRAEATGPGERLAWTPERRAGRLEWLRTCEVQAPDTPTTFARAVGWWLARYDDELERLESSTEGRGSEAERLLRAERALVALFAGRPRAVRELYRLHRGEAALAPWIEDHLRVMSTLDEPATGRLHLPVAWGELPAEERMMLASMGFAGRRRAAALRRPGRFWLAGALALGLAGGATLAAWREVDPGSREWIHDTMRPRPVPAELWVERSEAFRNRVTVATRLWQKSIEVPVDAPVALRWRFEPQPCLATLEGGLELWRCGSQLVIVSNLTTQRWLPIRTVLLTDGRLTDLKLRSFVLNDSFDWIIVGNSRVRHPGLPDPSREYSIAYWSRSNRLVIPLRERTKRFELPQMFEAGITIEESQLVNLVPDPRDTKFEPALGFFQLVRFGDCLLRQRFDEASGSTMVRLCGGTFTMGTLPDDPGSVTAGDDEQPMRDVTISDFWISKYEVTREQLRAWRAASSSSSNREDRDMAEDLANDMPEATAHLPATGVDWREAAAFCEAYGMRLPTEAEWEYAARAGTRTPWSSGEDEAALAHFAWYAANSGGRAHAVGTRLPNPWGLHDLHGNVAEWTLTEYQKAYSPAVTADAPLPATRAAVRGGSYDDPKGEVRSAHRGGLWLVSTGENLGFRCARGPKSWGSTAAGNGD